jgi:hypothetical protein
MSTALKPEKIVAVQPPQPTAPAVRAHKRALMRALEALQASAPELALESAKGQFGASDALINLGSKITAIEYELSLHDQVLALGMAEDAAADASYRSSIQTMDPNEIISGTTRDSCCAKCSPGAPGGCVISAPAARSGGICVHPVTQKHLWSRDETGRVAYPYEDCPRSYELYLAACRKLKVSPHER